MEKNSMSGSLDRCDAQQVINVAATCPSTHSLGPGTRAAVWVQGCNLRCPGCIAPEWIPIEPARLISPSDLASELLTHPAVTGLTISGGEPMLQAPSLAAMVRIARQMREINVICFTGYRIEQLVSHPPVFGVDELLSQVDVLIDGPFIASQNDNKGLRGSSNQRIHQLTHRLKGIDFNEHQRRVEINIDREHAFLVGVPTQAMNHAFKQAVDQLRMKASLQGGLYERV